MQVGNTGSKEFYRATKKHSGASHITELEDTQGILRRDRNDLEEICLSYYRTLYAEGNHSTAVEEARNEVLECLTDNLSAATKEVLDRLITLAELDNAVKDLALHKAPGKDGLITEFYQKFWPLMRMDYMAMLTDSLTAGRFPNGVTCGVLALLYRGGNRSLLTNWKPIALLNVAYKIYAKALHLRLQPILSEIISDDQSAFLPGRYILDNIMLTHETVEWARHSRQPMIFLKLDFSKAYDKVDFLFAAMCKMGLPVSFMAMVKILFEDAANHVNVNGRLSPEFQIQRGVRQGCPIAPYLFLIISEALNSIIKKKGRTWTCTGHTAPDRKAAGTPLVCRRY